MAEAVVGIRWLRADPYAKEGGKAGDQIESGVGEAAQHGRGAGGDHGIALHPQQQRRDGYAGIGCAAIEIAVIGAAGHVHRGASRALMGRAANWSIRCRRCA